MKKPLFDQMERIMIRSGYKPTLDRYNQVKACKDLKKSLFEALRIPQIVKWISKTIDKL